MNWFTFGQTSLCVGFERDGGACEGGNCEHLKHEDQAFGQSSENDSFGSEVYLMCEACYNEFLVERRTEAVTCYCCKEEFPRNETVFYLQYDTESIPSERFRGQVCKVCEQGERHQNNLRRDKEECERDQEDLFDGFDDFDEPDDHEEIPDDQFESFDDPRVSHFPLTIFNRDDIPDSWPKLYSQTIQKIVITERAR